MDRVRDRGKLAGTLCGACSALRKDRDWPW